MRAYEFPVKIAPGGELDLPDEMRRLVTESGEGRIILLLHEPGDGSEESWRRLAMDRFLSRTSDADSIYDEVEW
jgi:hypothetical protein